MSKIKIHIWLILVLGILILSFKCLIVYPVSHIGHNDAMGYAEMADSLIHGRGLWVDYVSFHFIKYENIFRPEDHWPPLYSFLIVPFYLILGKIAIAFKMPSLIISSIFIPIATYFLAKKLSKNNLVGLCAGITVMLYPKLFFWSLFCLSDITYTFVFLLFILFSIKGFDDNRYFYAMGICIGLGYYAKGTAILLIPAVVLFYLVKTGSISKIFHDKAFLIGIVLAILVIMPFWLRNYIHYGNPLHSTQNYWSGNIGYSIDGPSNGNTYRVYWDKTKPSWRNTKLPLGFGVIAQKSLQYFDTQFQWAFINMGRNEPMNLNYFLKLKFIKIIGKDFPSYPNGIPIAILGIPAFLGLIFMWRNRAIYIIPISLGILLFFLSVFWAPIDRLILVSVPLVIALGWTAYYSFLKRVSLFIPKYSEKIIIGILLFLIFVNAVYAIKSDYQAWKRGKGGAKTSFKGAVDQVRIYNRALSDDEISRNFRANSEQNEFVTEGLVSFWSFDKSTIKDGIVEDIWGNNTGTIIGNPQIIKGKVKEALHFDGNDSVRIPSNQSLELHQFTVETWVKGDESPQISDIATQWLEKGGNYVFSWNHNQTYAQSFAFLAQEGGWPVAKFNESLSGGKWYHIVGTWDGKVIKIYLDGILSNETKFDANVTINSTPLKLGGKTADGWFPYSNGVFDREQLLAAKWLKENTPPDSVIMDCDPWALQFYSDRKCVHFACDSVEEIFRVMRHYGVTHITYDTYEAAHPKTLDEFYNGNKPGFEMVYDISPRLKIYEVHYEILPDDLRQ